MATEQSARAFINAICDRVGLPHGATPAVILAKYDQLQAARSDEIALEAWAMRGGK